MRAVITTLLASGLGDMYTGIYQVYYLQEELKKIGYSVKTIIDLSTSPYKNTGEDREVFKRIFKLDLLDDIELSLKHKDLINSELSNSLNLVYSYEYIHHVFVDKKSENFDEIKHVKHSWYYRDDLPKINLLSDDVTNYAEDKIKKIGEFTIGVHFRPGDKILTQEDFDNILPNLEQVINENKNKKIFISTSKELAKKLLRNKNYPNVLINDFVFPEVHDSIRNMGLDDEQLYNLMKEILSEMYMISKCEKIYRFTPWFSGFLFFACTFNQTNVSNRLRFIPDHPIIPL